MHPHGSELVYCVSGSLTLLQKAPGAAQKQVELMAGEAAINPPGVWHTAKVSEPVTVLFITAGEGTQHGFPPADELPVT
jgi:quercetin dioxygenase-like cupin family protein